MDIFKSNKFTFLKLEGMLTSIGNNRGTIYVSNISNKTQK
jgi:hypothetical protein